MGKTFSYLSVSTWYPTTGSRSLTTPTSLYCYGFTISSADVTSSTNGEMNSLHPMWCGSQVCSTPCLILPPSCRSPPEKTCFLLTICASKLKCLTSLTPRRKPTLLLQEVTFMVSHLKVLAGKWVAMKNKVTSSKWSLKNFPPYYHLYT